MKHLNDAQVLRVIAAELTDAHGKEEVAEGQHAVNGKLSLTYAGKIEQLPLQLITQTPRIPLEVVLALVAERGGIKADTFAALLIAAAVEAAGEQEPASDFLEHTKRSLRDAKAQLAERLPKVERHGPLRRIVELSRIKLTPA